MTASPLLESISAARWFGGKGRRPRLVGVSPLPWLRPPGHWPAIRSEIAEIAYPDGDSEQYQLLIGYRPEPDQPEPLVAIDDPDHGRLAGVDATADPALHAALLDMIVTSRRLGEGPSALIAHRLGRERTPGAMASRVFSGEQSNTSILYADVALLKVFRRLQPGRNPDIETHERLTRAGNRSVARLLGWLEAERSGRSPAVRTDLAMLVEQLSGARDGWELALDALRNGKDFSDAAADLGIALAQIHRDLRTQFGTERTDGGVLADAMQSRLDAAAQVVPELDRLRTRLGVVFDRLRHRSVQVQRLHGDFHLGQTLLTADGWKIIDFEGEPAKAMADRLVPDSVWRDIAGALRSFDYAAAHGTDVDTDRWAADCCQAFLSGYAGAEQDGPAADEATLPAYLADKAIYEVVYEARNRPDWLQIPLAAATALAAAVNAAADEPS